jgi:hypothetical protein
MFAGERGPESAHDPIMCIQLLPGGCTRTESKRLSRHCKCAQRARDAWINVRNGQRWLPTCAQVPAVLLLEVKRQMIVVEFAPQQLPGFAVL